MKQNVLFRLAIQNLPKRYYHGIDAKITDDFISKHVELYTPEMDYGEAIKRGLKWYGRDLMTQWNNKLLINPNLPDYISKELSSFVDIEKHPIFSIGGRFVIGEHFILISDIHEKEVDEFEILKKNCKLDLPIYFLPSNTSITDSHIDCDYAIVDKAKILYTNNSSYNKSRELLEEIASNHDYELRIYDSIEENKLMQKVNEIDNCDISSDEIFERFSIKDDKTGDNQLKIKSLKLQLKQMKSRGYMSLILNGINLIAIESKIFTTSISEDEKKYLTNKGIDAITIPLDGLNSGGGVRCAYGQLISN